jgi:hypothetical protein
METTTEETPVESPIADAQEPASGADGGTVDPSPKDAKDTRWAGLKGNKNGATRGDLWSLNRKRQKGMPVDRRTRSGKVERVIVNLLTEDYGGSEAITTRQSILIGLVGLDCARLTEHKRARRLWVEKTKESARKKGLSREMIALIGRSPKDLAAMDSYMQPVVNSLRNNLAALGVEPEKQGERLEDILSKIANEGESGSDGDGGGE